MLPVLLSVLCASCGSSGIPSEPDSTLDLQNSETIASVSTSDSIIGRGFSGFSVSDAQAPMTQPPVLLAAAETDLVAPGQSVSSALQALGSAIATPEPVSVLSVDEESNETEEDVLTPEAQVEMAALESELAALAAESEGEGDGPQIEVLSPADDEDDGSDDDDTGGDGPGTSGTVSYDSIEANGLANGTYPSDDYYLAEFLFQNPDVCFWEQDTENRTITSVETPRPPENAVYMPSPSGGDDTSMLENFFKKNAGKAVDGDNRTYKVKTLDITNRIDIFNMAMEPASGAKQMVRIKASDVRIFNSPINGKNLDTLAIGFNVEDGAHRFVLVNSDVKDFHHKKSANAAAVFIRGANDFQIVCNKFENILNSTNDKSKTAGARAIWMQGRKVHNLSGGLIASNTGINNQSNGFRNDAEYFVIQGYNSINTAKPLRIFANRSYNTGKRFTKSQEGDTVILSNYVEWNTKTGPLGRRTLGTVFDIHKNDNVIIRNNRVSISAEGDFGSVFRTDASSGSHANGSGKIQNNIHFDNNDIELKENRDPNAKWGPSLISVTASHVGENATGVEAKNSSANNNNIHGPGSLRYYYQFRNGYSDDGGRFEHKNNVFSVPAYKSDYL